MDIVERFLKYVSFETTSDAESETCPSSPKELELGRFLAEEMKAIGLENARIARWSRLLRPVQPTWSLSPITTASTAVYRPQG